MRQKYSGLTTSQVEDSRKKHGSNQLSEVVGETFWDKLKGNLGDPIIRILIFALIINVIFAFMGQTEWYESFGIAIAVALATLIGTWSEHSNENAFQKLQADASKIMCKVFRNGHVEEVCIDDIVKGDLVILQSGDKIPADGKLISGEIRVDQSSLNGESVEAKKVVLPDGQILVEDDTFDSYLVLRGTVVTSGEAILEVTKVGDKTFYGAMAQELTVEERESPLKVKLSNLADLISKIGYTAGVLIAISFMVKKILIDNGFNTVEIMNYFSNFAGVANDIVEAIILAVIIIVVAVPEGLPMMIALVLSMNMKKMLKDNVLVRKLVGIETSGSLNILFSDKTGTITKGQLETVLFKNGNNSDVVCYKEIPTELRKIVHTSILSNTNAVISENEDGSIQIIGGNATEKAVLGFITKKETFFDELNVVKSIPFSSDKKFSASVVKGNFETTLVKGAPENILPYCTHFYDIDGNVKPFEKLEEINRSINELATRSIRVLVLATTNEEVTDESLPKSFTFVGVLGIRDDVRPEAVSAIKQVQAAGVQVVMITGDRKETAVAIAKEANILTSKKDIILTSQELNQLSDDEVKSMLPNIRVISRALPTDKSRLVRISQELGLVVGMTGDGVNDSPALKRADVGFAMGSGTEVAKEAGDVVILDDNFDSIAKAILYGRTIYRSIQKFIVFQLTINVAALLTCFIAPFIGIEHPLTITQMLWVNLVMDTLAALAFGAEPTLRRYMKEKPKKRDENIVSKEMVQAISVAGISLTALGIFMLQSDMVSGMFRNETALYTAYFTFFIFFSVANGFNARTEKLNIFENIRKNTIFLRVMGLIVVVQILMTFIGGEILRTVPLTINEWMVVFGLALIAIPLDLVRKFVTGIFTSKEVNGQVVMDASLAEIASAKED